MKQTFKENELVAVSLREKNTVRMCFGRCMGKVGSSDDLYLVNVFGVPGHPLRAISLTNPWYPKLTKADGEKLAPNTEPYAQATVRHMAKPRFTIERDPAKRLFHLQCWSFSMGTNTPWEPYDNVITTTIDQFVIHAVGDRPPLPFLERWTVFVTNKLEAEITEGTDPFERR